LLWKVLLISNFLPGQALMPVGPWWFIPFIMQVYLLYPFLLKGYQNYGNRFLILVSLASIIVKWQLNSYLIACNININYSMFGHLPVICLGMALAAQATIRIPSVYIFLACLFFIAGNINPHIWLVADIAFTTVFIALAMAILNSSLSNNLLTKFFVFYGGISFQLFMVNGFLRSPFHNFAEAHHIWWIDNLMALASLLFSSLFACVLKKLDDNLRKTFKPVTA
jgi:peptidoglycan/LPS O-acetylase OafA/YrhL